MSSRILIISHGVDGGINRVSTQLLESLRDTVTCNMIRVDPVYKSTIPNYQAGETAIVSDTALNSYISKAVFWLKARKKIIDKTKEFNPDAIIYSGFIPLIFFRNLASEKIFSIFWEHGPQKTLTGIKRILTSRIRNVDVIVSPTASSLAWLNEKLAPKYKNSLVIANWVYHKSIKKSDFNVINSSKFKAIVCSRIDLRQKDFKTLIDAISIVHQRGIPVEVDIFGQGPDEEKITSYIRSKALQDTVTLKGFSIKLADIYKDYDFSILPTRWEGFGLAIAESMAAGVPPISAAVEGVVDVIENMRTGLLYLPGNAASLAQKIELFYRLDSKEKFAMGRAAMLHAEIKFDPKTQLEIFSTGVMSLIATKKND